LLRSYTRSNEDHNSDNQHSNDDGSFHTKVLYDSVAGASVSTSDESRFCKITDYSVPSARATLAQRLLRILEHGQSVSSTHALQLRNWAISHDDAVLPLEELAHLILSQEEEQKSQTNMDHGTAGPQRSP
jgi:hypothetical protein